jgi:hypothetical protein
MQIAKRIYALAQEQNDPALMMGANRTLACTSYFLGHFEAQRRYAMQGLQFWRSEGIRSPMLDPPAIACLIDKAHLSGTSEKSPLATPPSRKRSPWQRN